MLNIFKKKNKILEAEIVVPLSIEEEQNTLSVPVRDIKKYLVDEFDRSRELQHSIEEYEQQEEEYYRTKLKYDATLVVVEEYKKRNEYQAQELHTQKLKYKEKLNEIADLEEEKNDLRIQLMQYDNKINEIDKFIDDNFNKITIEISTMFEDVIQNHKGNLSKQSSIKYLKEVVENINQQKK